MFQITFFNYIRKPKDQNDPIFVCLTLTVQSALSSPFHRYLRQNVLKETFQLTINKIISRGGKGKRLIFTERKIRN